MSELKVIYLGPACQEQGDGREWCQDDVWQPCECGHTSVKFVASTELDRVTAERDALQQRLNAADQRIDELERGRGKPVMKLEAERLWGGAGEYALSFVKPGWLDTCRETGGEFLLYAYPPAPVTVAMSDQLREAAKMIGIERMPPMEYDEP